MKSLTTLLLVTLLFGAFACTESDMAFEGPLLDDPLILGVRMEPPVAQGGVEITFDAIAHWPSGTPSRLWILCVPEFDSGVYDEPLTCVSNHLEPGAPLPACDFSDNMANFANPCSLGTGETAQFEFPASLSALMPPDTELFAFIHLVMADTPDVFALCGEGLAEGRPPRECMGAVKYLPVVSDEQVVTNVNPVLKDLRIDDLPVDATEIPSLAVSLPDNHRIVSITVDASSIDEIVRTTESGDIYMNLELKLYTDCGQLVYFPGDDEDDDIWRDFGDYDRELRCTNYADERGIVCEVAQVEWVVNEPGECKVVYVIRDNFGGMDFREQHVLFQ